MLTAVLWDSTAQRPAVEREVLQLVNPDAREALDLLDAIEELEAQLDAKAGQSREALSEWAIKEANCKLARAGKRLSEMRDGIGSGRAVGRHAGPGHRPLPRSPRPGHGRGARRRRVHGQRESVRATVMAKTKTLAKLADLAGKAGRWLGLAAPPVRHTGRSGRTGSTR